MIYSQNPIRKVRVRKILTFYLNIPILIEYFCTIGYYNLLVKWSLNVTETIAEEHLSAAYESLRGSTKKITINNWAGSDCICLYKHTLWGEKKSCQRVQLWLCKRVRLHTFLFLHFSHPLLLKRILFWLQRKR